MSLKGWYQTKQIALAADKLGTLPRFVDIEFRDLSINGPGWYAWDRVYPGHGTCKVKHHEVIGLIVRKWAVSTFFWD